MVQSMALGVDEFAGLLVLAVWFAPSELGCWDAAVFAVVPAVAGGHVVWGVVDSAASTSAQSGCWGWASSKNADHDGSFLVVGCWLLAVVSRSFILWAFGIRTRCAVGCD